MLREGTIISDVQVQEDKWKMMFWPNFGVSPISFTLNESFNETLAGLSYNWVFLLDIFFGLFTLVCKLFIFHVNYFHVFMSLGYQGRSDDQL